MLSDRVRLRDAFQRATLVLGGLPGAPRGLKHSSNVEVFHEHSIVLFDEPRRQLVLEVQHFSLETTLCLGDRPALLLVVPTPVFFPRELALLAAEALRTVAVGEALVEELSETPGPEGYDVLTAKHYGRKIGEDRTIRLHD